MLVKINNMFYGVRSSEDQNKFIVISLVRMCIRIICSTIQYRHTIEDLELPLTLKIKINYLWPKFCILNYPDEDRMCDDCFESMNLRQPLKIREYLAILKYKTYNRGGSPIFWFYYHDVENLVVRIDYYILKSPKNQPKICKLYIGSISRRRQFFKYNHDRYCIQCFNRLLQTKNKKLNKLKYWTRRTKTFTINIESTESLFNKYFCNPLYYCRNCVLHMLIMFEPLYGSFSVTSSSSEIESE